MFAKLKTENGLRNVLYWYGVIISRHSCLAIAVGNEQIWVVWFEHKLRNYTYLIVVCKFHDDSVNKVDYALYGKTLLQAHCNHTPVAG